MNHLSQPFGFLSPISWISLEDLWSLLKVMFYQHVPVSCLVWGTARLKSGRRQGNLCSYYHLLRHWKDRQDTQPTRDRGSFCSWLPPPGLPWSGEADGPFVDHIMVKICASSSSRDIKCTEFLKMD
jgi:hypothetical protein